MNSKNIPILDSVPDDGVEVDENGFFKDFERAKEKPERLKNPYYYCRYCKGYLAGRPIDQGENNLGPLAGRMGISYTCIRCRQELAFNGIIS